MTFNVATRGNCSFIKLKKLFKSVGGHEKYNTHGFLKSNGQVESTDLIRTVEQFYTLAGSINAA